MTAWPIRLRADEDSAYKARGHDKPDASRQLVNERVEELAKKKGHSMAQIALAWVLQNPTVSAPIVGSTKMESIQELVDAVHVKLSEEEKKYIDEAYQPQQIVSLPVRRSWGARLMKRADWALVRGQNGYMVMVWYATT